MFHGTAQAFVLTCRSRNSARLWRTPKHVTSTLLALVGRRFPHCNYSEDFDPESLLFDDELSLFELDSLDLLAASLAVFAASAPFLYELLR